MLEAVLQLGKINNIQKHISVITGLVVRVIVCFQFSSSFRPKSGNFFPLGGLPRCLPFRLRYFTIEPVMLGQFEMFFHDPL